jgi:hypothetical protein
MVREYFLDLHPGTAPLIMSATYTADECSPPSWDQLHPVDSALDWPEIIPAIVDESGGGHPALPTVDAGARVFWIPPAALFGSLEEAGRSVMLATTWAGTEIFCTDGNLTLGAIVIRAGWDQDEPPEAEVFAAASARADEVGITALDDLAVAWR